MKYVLEVFKKYAVFTGRARRAEYWYFSLFITLISMTLNVAGKVVDDSFYVIDNILYLIIFIPGLAVGVRRLHDIGKSGWWMLLVLLPIIGWIWLIVLAVIDSTSGTNEYGPNPKGILDNKIGNI